MKPKVISFPARLEPVSRIRASYGVTYVRTANGQIWRAENLALARQRWASVQ